MEKYRNTSGKSNVTHYEIGIDFIDIKFNNSNKIYRYSYFGGAGRMHVEQLKKKAIQGYGLNSYVNTYTKYKYDK